LFANEAPRVTKPHVAAPDSGRVAIASGPRRPGASWANLDAAPSFRGGFKAARRHTARVKVFRRVALAVSLAGIAVIAGAAAFNPFKHPSVNVSIGRVDVAGTKITVESPRINGLQKNGSPFEIKARSGIQDTATPDLMELLGIRDTNFAAPDSSTTSISADRGIYDSLQDKMTLEGNVQIKSSTGYDLRLKTALIDFKTGGLSSTDPVQVLLDGGSVAARGLDVSDNGHKVSFDGDVTSMFENGTGGQADAPAQR